ncbi:hypothetical protein [Rubrivirga sp. IMCC45206]|uniref:hypothetical protein n=1 Tax=Rubrivirga sp. IMCC45206 TaxID=3391614 RepID=UPI00399000AA
MSRVLSLTLLATLLLGDAPTADAQIGRLLDRAKEAVSGRAEQARRAADRPPARADGAPAPAIDFAALLDTRFDRDRGTFHLDQIPLLFPLPGLAEQESIDAGWRIRNASGEVTGRQTLSSASETLAAAIVNLMTRAGVPGDDQAPLEPGGSYTLDVELYGEVVGSLPFTVSMVESGDPYRPSTAWVLDGPWRTHAYFEHSVEDPEAYLNFNAWVGPDDGPTGETVEVTVRRGGEEVAWGRGGHISTDHGWLRRRFELIPTEFRDLPDGRRADERFRRPWTIQDVTAGTYEIVLATESGPFRTFTIEATDGAFVPHPRSDLNHEPRTRYLTTRVMLSKSLERQSSFRKDYPQMLYWIGPDE